MLNGVSFWQAKVLADGGFWREKVTLQGVPHLLACTVLRPRLDMMFLVSLGVEILQQGLSITTHTFSCELQANI